jgi:hypothetical protein
MADSEKRLADAEKRIAALEKQCLELEKKAKTAASLRNEDFDVIEWCTVHIKALEEKCK